MPSLNEFGFDTSLNSDYHKAFIDSESNIVSDLFGGVVASTVDFGASIWNSLPMTEEVTTRDLLSRINDNALRVYEEHPDAVHAASFIGGIFVPSGLALKGMRALRAGQKGVNWFSEAGKVKDMSVVEKLFAEGPKATAEWAATRRTMLAKGLANDTLDAVAMEAAVVASMNAHPWMEDYMQDPAGNFLISAAFGGVIGGGVGLIANHSAMKKLEGAIASKAQGLVGSDLLVAPSGALAATQLQSHRANIENLKGIINNVGKEGPLDRLNGYTKALAEKALDDEMLSEQKVWENLFDAKGIKYSPEELATVRKMFSIDPNVLDVENAYPAFMKSEAFVSTKGAGQVKTQELNQGFVLSNPKAGSKNTPSLKSKIYYTEWGKTGSTASMKYMGRAGVLGVNEGNILSGVDLKHSHRITNPDAGLEFVVTSAPDMDKKYLQELMNIARLSDDEFKKVVVSPDDLPRLKAIMARASTDPDKYKDFKILVTSDMPSYEVLERTIIQHSQEMATGVKGSGSVSQTAGHGVAATHFEDITKLVTDQKYNLASRSANLSPSAKKSLDGWVNAGLMNSLRTAYADLLNGIRNNPATSALVKDLDEMRNSASSLAFREKLLENADSAGFVYLWRGTGSGKARMYMPIESYSSKYEVALSFAHGNKNNVKLHRIDVNQVIGAVQHPGYHEFEILVGAPTHTQLAQLPIVSGGKVTAIASKTAPQTLTTTISETVKTTSVQQGKSIDEIRSLLEKTVTDRIDTMVLQGVPLETISIKTSTPLKTLEAYVTNPAFDSIVDAATTEGWMSYTNAADLGKYLSPTKHPLVLQGNQHKAKWASLQAIGLDSRFHQLWNEGILNDILQVTKSGIASDLGKQLIERKPVLDLMRKMLENAVNPKMGSRGFSSADFATRDMDDLGIFVAEFGQWVSEFKNKAIEKIAKPLSEHTDFAKTDLGLIEFNTALNVNAGLKGKRFYRDRQFWQIREEKLPDGSIKEIAEAVAFEGKPFKIVDDAVDKFFLKAYESGRELYFLGNTRRKMLGLPDMQDIGLWLPSYNPIGKAIAYVQDLTNDTTRLILASDDKGLAEAIRTYEAANSARIAAGTMKVFTKGDGAIYAQLAGRLDPLTMEKANEAMYHSGSSALAVVKANPETVADLIQGYEYTINKQISGILETYLEDMKQTLGRMSSYNQQMFANQPYTSVGKWVKAPKDAAKSVENILFGRNSLQEAPMWATLNKGFEGSLEMVLSGVKSVFDELAKPIGKVRSLIKKAEGEAISLRDEDWKTFHDRAKKAGMVDPYEHFSNAAEMFEQAKMTELKSKAPRLIYASNGLAATMALRFGELAQPLVNAMSLPILTMSVVGGRMPETFMGVQKGTAKIGSIAEVMHQGVRHMNSVHGKNLDDIWLKAGDYKALVSEANELLKLPLQTEVGMLPSLERAMQSTFVKALSSPADLMETFTRRVTMHTGAHLAKRLYPELNDLGVTIFARHFRDRAIGNYMAAQRPTAFQGTMGVAMGLFQTYMLTFAQNMYRHLELKDYKAIGKTMLMQSTVFGAGSLPGFDLVSNTIGEHYSDENYDLTTGTFRAVGDPAASFILYGLPSNIGPAFYTRGEIQPRIVNPALGLDSFVGANMMLQTGKAAADVVGALASDYPDIARNLGEALSLQSVSRPIARWSELFTRNARTRKGETVAVPEEVWSPVGIASRLLSTRPLEEAKLREAIHLNSFYGSLDADARGEATEELRTALRAGSLTDEKLAEIAEKYMRTGTPRGWQAALNHAVATSNTSGIANLLDKLKPTHPLNHMINSLDGEE